MDPLSVTDALSLVLALGQTLGSSERGRLRPQSAYSYAELGFNLIQEGEPGLHSALLRLETRSAYLDMADLRRLLNPLLLWLERNEAEATKPIGDAIKSHVRSWWIVPPKSKLLGDLVSTNSPAERVELGRRLGLNLPILDRLLRHVGIGADGLGPDETAVLEGWVASTASLPRTKHMLGLDTATIRTLEIRGVLQAVPWTFGDPLGVRYDRTDLERVAAGLDFDVPELKHPLEGHVTFDRVARVLRYGSGRGDRASVVMGILRHRLRPCAKLNRGSGPTSFLFDEREVENLTTSDCET